MHCGGILPVAVTKSAEVSIYRWDMTEQELVFFGSVSCIGVVIDEKKIYVKSEQTAKEIRKECICTAKLTIAV